MAGMIETKIGNVVISYGGKDVCFREDSSGGVVRFVPVSKLKGKEPAKIYELLQKEGYDLPPQKDFISGYYNFLEKSRLKLLINQPV